MCCSRKAQQSSSPTTAPSPVLTTWVLRHTGLFAVTPRSSVQHQSALQLLGAACPLQPGKCLYTTIRELVENALDAAESISQLPDIDITV